LVSLATSRQNLSEAEVKQAASGDLLTFMISELNRAAEQKKDEQREGNLIGHVA
jgi:hypothetical protein